MISVLRQRVALLVLALLVCWPLPGLTAEPPTVLITGSSRGIGLALATEYARRGWRVIATARNPAASAPLQALAEEHDSVLLEALDVSDAAQISALAEKYAGQPIDVLLNNAGISGVEDMGSLGRLNYAVYDEVHAVNVLGPLRMTEAFLSHVAASGQKKIISISSTEGSLGMVRGRGGSYFYRSSKAALNMVMRSLAVDLKSRGIVVGLVSPGLVRSDFMMGLDLPIMISPEESAEAVVRVIDSFEPSMSGSFIRHTGKPVPW